MFVCLFVCLFVCFRATTLEEKGEQFWYQGDFGYVKQVVDSLMELCAPQALVRNQAIHVVIGRIERGGTGMGEGGGLRGRGIEERGRVGEKSREGRSLSFLSPPPP